MGDPLDLRRVASFFDELEKLGSAPKVTYHGLRELFKRIGSPGEGLRRGWEGLSPTKLIQQGGKGGKSIEQAVARTQAAEQALKTRGPVTTRYVEPLRTISPPPEGVKIPKMPTYQGETPLGRARAHLAVKLRAGTHLAPEAELSKGVKGVAERLSRGGWTGEGALTKYVPLGQKSWFTLGAAPQVYDIAKGPEPGGPSRAEQIGSLAGFTLPGIMFGGMPTASLVGSLGGMMAGGALGKRLDTALAPRTAQQEFTRPPPTAIQSRE